MGSLGSLRLDALETTVYHTTVILLVSRLHSVFPLGQTDSPMSRKLVNLQTPMLCIGRSRILPEGHLFSSGDPSGIQYLLFLALAVPDVGCFLRLTLLALSCLSFVKEPNAMIMPFDAKLLTFPGKMFDYLVGTRKIGQYVGSGIGASEHKAFGHMGYLKIA